MDGREAEPKHSSAPEGKAISAAAVKNQYLLINFRRLPRLVKSRRSDVCVGTLPPLAQLFSDKKKKTTANRGLMEAEWNVGVPPKHGAGSGKERQPWWRKVEREEQLKSLAKCTLSVSCKRAVNRFDVTPKASHNC